MQGFEGWSASRVEGRISGGGDAVRDMKVEISTLADSSIELKIEGRHKFVMKVVYDDCEDILTAVSNDYDDDASGAQLEWCGALTFESDGGSVRLDCEDKPEVWIQFQLTS